ncbi:MAG: hypothetical protein IT494_05325 [Gammaproteobacteria bacterium]|nr:hypothetical protein [Gammaproteobacteria bacterium]
MIAILTAALLVYSVPARLHHSGAMYDQTRRVDIAGVVTEFNWSNPHASFRVDVTGSDGKISSWPVVMGSPNNLVRRGWKRTSLQKGDRVTVTIFPLRDGTPGGYYVSVLLADGKRLDGDPPEAGAGEGAR